MTESELLRNAWHNTKPFLRAGRKLTFATLLALLSVPVAFLAQDDAKALFGLGGIVALFLLALAGTLFLVFLWNLWLAPHRLAWGRAEASMGLDVVRETPVLEPKPERADLSNWKHVPEFHVWEVADLCGGISPIEPNGEKNDAVRAMLTQLTRDLEAGTLRPIEDPFLVNYEFAKVTREELQRYFTERGSVPEFLQ